MNKLKEAIAAVINKPAERKSTAAGNIESTATVKLLLKEILVKLDDEMDDEIEALIEDEEFVNGYFVVRRTDDRRGRGPGKKDNPPAGPTV